MPADPTADWIAVGIEGANPWQWSWESTGEITRVQHPAYPTPVQDVAVSTMQVGGKGDVGTQTGILSASCSRCAPARCR
jgi:hypothetical protein